MTTPRPTTPKKPVEILPRGWDQLGRDFFDVNPEYVAKALLGKLLVHRSQGVLLAGRIVETEAYLGENDPAAHAASGRTVRNDVLFGPPGHAYVYRIYGIHFCLNVSCLPAGVPGCVLLRALEPVAGIDQMQHNRGLGPAVALNRLASGPGRLCQALNITRLSSNGLDMTAKRSPLAFCGDGFEPEEISSTPRIGIRKAADLPLRFFIVGNACVSAGRWQKNIVDQPGLADVGGDRKQRA